ncbi:MAG: hypothetical protein ABSA85_14295 [Terracidiphilus sp.]
MKNRILAIVGLALLAAVSASAQNTPVAQVNVPFAFRAGNQQMPAGIYVISKNSFLFKLRGVDIDASALVPTHPATAKTASTAGYVLFDRIEGRYFLAGIWPAGSNEGARCYPNQAEKEALESLHQTSSPTTLALNTSSAR